MREEREGKPVAVGPYTLVPVERITFHTYREGKAGFLTWTPVRLRIEGPGGEIELDVENLEVGKAENVPASLTGGDGQGVDVPIEEIDLGEGPVDVEPVGSSA